MGKRQDVRAVLLTAVIILLAACGDPSLDGFGVTEDWLGDRTSGTNSTTQTTAQPTVTEVSSLTWYTPLADAVPDDPDAVIEQLWSESSQEDAFVQASANQISGALPDIKVPRVLPADTRHVTSQLVFGVSTGRLTNAYVAAFGFWTSEPYVTSRSVSQIAQLSVAIDESDPAPATDDTTLGCIRFNSTDVISCDPVAVDGSRAWWVIELDGAKLVWYDNGFRYELLDRQRIGVEAMTETANSMMLLAGVDFPDQAEP